MVAWSTHYQQEATTVCSKNRLCDAEQRVAGEELHSLGNVAIAKHGLPDFGHLASFSSLCIRTGALRSQAEDGVLVLKANDHVESPRYTMSTRIHRYGLRETHPPSQSMQRSGRWVRPEKTFCCVREVQFMEQGADSASPPIRPLQLHVVLYLGRSPARV